jgi:hypothetical protein
MAKALSDALRFCLGLGFGIDGVKGPVVEIESVGAFAWRGFYYTSFIIDPKEAMIVISMAQLHPTGGLALDAKVRVLAYQALTDWHEGIAGAAIRALMGLRPWPT